MPRVTVLIPTYNAAAYLTETLESVCAQVYRDFELLIVDDGSQDPTLEIARRFESRLALRIITQANAGPAAARNRGVRAAHGEYVAFIDSDDLMLPRRLQAQVAMLDSEPALALAHTDLMTFDERGVIHASRRAFSNPCGGRILDKLLLDNFITTSTVMASRARLIDAGLFDESRRISEDFDLWLRMAERWNVGYVDEPVVKYRRRPGSLSEDKLRTGLAALEVIESFWKSHADYARANPALRRQSLAKHLEVAGSAAVSQGRTLTGLKCLLRALRQAPAHGAAWKWVAKALLAPLRPAQPTQTANVTTQRKAA